MAINPKLEFFRFKINHESKKFKTFKNFAVEILNTDENSTDSQFMQEYLAHFLSSLDNGAGIDDRVKKQITLVRKEEVNKFLNYQPSIKSGANVLHGVINGGNYGRMRILTKVDSNEESSELDETNSVLQYFYFYLYIPLDHNEGCFIIQSNGAAENVTKLFRKFITSLFKTDEYFDISSEAFCPKTFQNEFKYGAVLKSMSFKHSFIDNLHNMDGISDILSNFDITIKAVPKQKDVSISLANEFKRLISSFTFGRNSDRKKIDDFAKTKFEAKSTINNSVKTFEWNTRDEAFSPVVYLKDRIDKFNDDGTVDFDELIALCHNLFTDEVLPEIRPDLYVKRAL